MTTNCSGMQPSSTVAGKCRETIRSEALTCTHTKPERRSKANFALAKFRALNSVEKQKEIQMLLEQGIYKAHIREYIPGSSVFLQ